MGGFKDYTYNPPIIFAEFQAWFGTYIDPSNIARFVTSDGRPEDPSGAERVFGRPQLQFRRNKKLGRKFETNLGTAGPFVKLGGIGDYAIEAALS